MPYYIYRIKPGETSTAKTLELVVEFESYREAKQAIKTLRMEENADSGHQFKIIFADNQPEAEQRLLEHREQPILKEWEK